MRFPQFSRSFVRRARGLSFSVVAVSFGFAFACSNEHLGRPCDPGTPAPAGTAGGQIVTVASPALECPSHICVGATNPQGTGALCSAGCESSADGFRERADVETVTLLLTLEQVGLGRALIVTLLQDAVVLGAESLAQHGCPALPHRHRRQQGDDNDGDDCDQDPRPGSHRVLLCIGLPR